MTKTLRRVVSVVAALAVMMLMVVPFGTAPSAPEKAWAASDNTITIENAQPGQKYQLYKLFNATTTSERASGTSETSGIAYSYSLDSNNSKNLDTDVSYTGIDGQTHSVKGSKWFTRDTAGNVKANEDVTTSSLTTEEFQQWARGFGEKVGVEKQISGSEAGELKFENLPDGYYFITSTMGSLVTVTSVAPSAKVSDKNGTPAVVKSEDVKTSSVGDEVTYTVEVNLPAGSKNVILHDKLGAGLSLVTEKDNVTMTTGAASGEGAAAFSDANYTINNWSDSKASSGVGSGDNITITFKDSYTQALAQQTAVYLQYKVKLTNQAGVNMLNDAHVTYGDNNTESTHAKVYESAFGFQVNKIDGSSNGTALSGAKFVLSEDGNLGDLSEGADSSVVKTSDNTDVGSKLLAFSSTGVYEPAGTSKLLTANNSLTFSGLNDNRTDTIIYYLYEVKAPDGYSKLTGPITIRIIPTFSTDSGATTQVTSYKVEFQNPGSQTWEEAANPDGTDSLAISAHQINVSNTQGSPLPNTGGPGTVWLYVVGGVLVVAAGVALIARRRMRQH